MKPFYWFAITVTSLTFKLLYGVKLYEMDQAVIDGPAILASNHISLCDPPLLGSFYPHEVHFMAKSELFKNPLFGTMIRNLNAFPVKRGVIDRRALEYAGNILKDGGKLVMFPEGTRQKSGILQKGRPGVAKIALENDTPIIPVCIQGSNHLRKLLPPGRCIKILFGRPFEIADFETDKESRERIRLLTEKIISEIRALQDRLKKYD